ncbi:MAG: DMT family transporter, partial [Pseudomonadota bacterium]
METEPRAAGGGVPQGASPHRDRRGDRRGERRALGLALCVLALALFACQDAITRYLVQDLSVPQILTVRFIGFAALAFVLAFARRGVRGALATRHPVLQIGRSALLVGEIAIFSLGLRSLGLADMHAVFAAFPLIVTALAGPLLGEQIGWRRWVGVVIGFCGALVILRPGFEVFRPEALLPV